MTFAIKFFRRVWMSFISPSLPLTVCLIAIASDAPAQQTRPAPPTTSPPNLSSLPFSAQQTQTPNVLTLDEALRLASIQASDFQQAKLNEQIAAEDIRQAKAAFLPRVTAPIDYIYTSPALGLPAGSPRTFSFIAANAINEYQGLVNVTGDVDIAGRLRGTLTRNRALLAAAQAGTEIARRALNLAVVETYYGLALAIAQRQTAEQSLLAADEFERITSLLLSGGEVAAVDLTRAQLQTSTRRDELERARANEIIAAAALRVLVGYDFLQPITTTNLPAALPVDDEVTRITADMISRRPEFAQFDAERRAAEEEVRIAKAEKLPQVSYSINSGFDTDSFQSTSFKEHTGISAAISVSFPIFDWGARKSRERQARLRAEILESRRAQTVRTFAEQFYVARGHAISAKARIALATASIARAQDNVNASISRYRAGEASIIEVTDAQSILVAQRQALYQAFFDYQVAVARLKQAAGQ